MDLTAYARIVATRPQTLTFWRRQLLERMEECAKASDQARPSAEQALAELVLAEAIGCARRRESAARPGARKGRRVTADCGSCRGSGWSPHPMFICGKKGCEVERQLCERCLGSGRYITNRPLFKQRMGRVLRAHREKHGESVFQEAVRIGLSPLMGPKMVRAIESGKLTALCAYAPRFVQRAARVTWRQHECAPR